MDLSSHLPFLRELSTELVAVVATGLKATPYSEDNDLEFMALCFVSKQLDHAAAIQRLEGHPDTNLIARTMIEGAIQLLWAARERESRPKRWRAFVAITDWRLMRRQERAGEAIPEEVRLRTEDALRRHGPMFTRAAKDEAQRRPRGSRDDPYDRDWRGGVSIRDLAIEIGQDELYQSVYRFLSGWHHWNVEAIGAVLNRSANGVRFAAGGPASEAAALNASFLTLLVVAQVAFAHRDHRSDARLAALERRFNDWRGSLGDQ